LCFSGVAKHFRSDDTKLWLVPNYVPYAREVDSRQYIVDRRQQTAESKEQIVDGREQTADKRRHTAASRH
jgi:hypothetical protein